MVICWQKLFRDMHCFMMFICDAESEFNDSINERQHLLNHNKELKQLKNISAGKAASIKVTTKYKIQHQILLPVRKKKNKSGIYQKYFQIKLLVLPKNHQCDVLLLKILLKMMVIYNQSQTDLTRILIVLLLEAILCIVLVFQKLGATYDFASLTS